MFCDHTSPCAICLPNYKEEAVTEKKDRCNLCAVHVKPDEQGEWNGSITDEGVIYCWNCHPEVNEIEFTERDEYDDRDDAEADGEVLASAGWGTDEDYGYYGDEY